MPLLFDAEQRRLHGRRPVGGEKTKWEVVVSAEIVVSLLWA